MSNFFFAKDEKTEILEEGKNYRKMKAHNGSLMILEVIFENGGEGAPHTHTHEQISYCLEGEFEYTVEGETHILKQGDSVYVPSDALHGCKVLSPKGKLIDVFTPQRQDFLK